MARYGLIGRSLGHSFSQRYFTEKFKREGRSAARYDLFELAEVTELPDLIRNTPGLRGLNVTIPYKQAVVPLLNELDPVAAAVGAVNTIAIHADGRTTGHNTDVEGFRSTLQPLLERLSKRDRTDADVQNLLGYSYRNAGQVDKAFTAYHNALRLDPNHKGAHEYIGIAYLLSKQPDKAKEHLARLKVICGGETCEEYQDLAKAIAAYTP